MAENSGIQWTHHTFNPWTGCTKATDTKQGIVPRSPRFAGPAAPVLKRKDHS